MINIPRILSKGYGLLVFVVDISGFHSYSLDYFGWNKPEKHGKIYTKLIHPGEV